ncbi:peptide ABC transporter ATP-binding protein [Alcanivorax sp. N3-2A]|nr:peptide ABC transporter ATP-binding protein [Alcanivorax sp. N3-2A]|tara:strand:- start:5421 stop:6458 length:1038 start_codon:yes stop_codon:yes gene_type:complete
MNARVSSHSPTDNATGPRGANAGVRAEDLTIHFATKAGTVKAVDGVSFEIEPGETFGIIGESGSGKTTLGRALAGLLKASGGDIHYGEHTLGKLPRAERQRLRRDYQIIFQDPHAALNPRMTILQSVMEPLEILKEGDKSSRQRAAREALERVGLAPEIGRRYPHELSGGQKQRVNIARTLTVRPKFIVCDEVVAALDVSIRGAVLNLFAELQEEFGITYAFITHDISVVSHVSDRIGVLYLGRLMEMGPTGAVTDAPLHPYTQALLSAEPLPLPGDQRDQRRRIRLEGEIPSPLAPPSGCRFRTRCPAAQTRCAEQIPEWREARPGHWVACHFADADGPPGPVR